MNFKLLRHLRFGGIVLVFVGFFTHINNLFLIGIIAYCWSYQLSVDKIEKHLEMKEKE